MQLADGTRCWVRGCYLESTRRWRWQLSTQDNRCAASSRSSYSHALAQWMLDYGGQLRPESLQDVRDAQALLPTQDAHNMVVAPRSKRTARSAPPSPDAALDSISQLRPLSHFRMGKAADALGWTQHTWAHLAQWPTMKTHVSLFLDHLLRDRLPTSITHLTHASRLIPLHKAAVGTLRPVAIPTVLMLSDGQANTFQPDLQLTLQSSLTKSPQVPCVLSCAILFLDMINWPC